MPPTLATTLPCPPPQSHRPSSEVHGWMDSQTFTFKFESSPIQFWIHRILTQRLYFTSYSCKKYWANLPVAQALLFPDKNHLEFLTQSLSRQDIKEYEKSNIFVHFKIEKKHPPWWWFPRSLWKPLLGFFQLFCSCKKFMQKVFWIFNASFKKRVFLFPQYKDCQKSNQDSEWRKLLLCSIQIIKQNRFILVLCYFPVHYYFFLIRSDSGN